MGIGHINFIAYAVYGEVLYHTSLVDVADTHLSRPHLLPRSRSPFFLPPPPLAIPMPQIHVTPEQARSLPVYV